MASARKEAPPLEIDEVVDRALALVYDEHVGQHAAAQQVVDAFFRRLSADTIRHFTVLGIETAINTRQNNIRKGNAEPPSPGRGPRELRALFAITLADKLGVHRPVFYLTLEDWRYRAGLFERVEEANARRKEGSRSIVALLSKHGVDRIADLPADAQRKANTIMREAFS